MATNRVIVKESDNGGIFPLRGDMDVLVNFRPTESFGIRFVTYTDADFVINFQVCKIRLPDQTLADSMTVGGKASLFVELKFNAKYDTWDIVGHNLFAATAGSGGGGGSGGTVGGGGEPDEATGFRPEVLLLPDANGVLTPDGSISNRFRFQMTRNITLANPVNFFNNEHIYLTGYQDEGGGKKISFGRALMLPGQMPYVPPQNPNAAFLVELRPTQHIKTGALNWALVGYPDKTMANGLGLVTELTMFGDKKYYTMAQTFADAKGGGTIKILRNGLSAEVTATLECQAGNTYIVAGLPIITNSEDKRPTLELLGVDFGSGGANRPAWGKALLNFEGSGKVYVRDLIIQGTRAEDGSGRGICPNGTVEIHVNNVRLYNNNNGMMWGHMASTIYVTDSQFDFNGIGTEGREDGYTHNLYAGHSDGVVALRCSFTRSQKGHDFKSRAAYSELKQCFLSGANEGRELELPNGGRLLAEHCVFEKVGGKDGQNDLCVFGQEGIEKDRPREYIMRNCRFINQRGAGTTSTFVHNMDAEVPCRIIDPEFVGDWTLARPDKGLINCIVEYTGGPLGPQLPVGHPFVEMTPPV
jgi:hypothetical protein